jgi:hypothetical protein
MPESTVQILLTPNLSQKIPSQKQSLAIDNESFEAQWHSVNGFFPTQHTPSKQQHRDDQPNDTTLAFIFYQQMPHRLKMSTNPCQQKNKRRQKHG